MDACVDIAVALVASAKHASWSMLADRCCNIAALLRHSCSCSRAGSQELSATGTKADEAESTPPKAKFSPGDAADKEFKANGKILQPIVGQPGGAKKFRASPYMVETFYQIVWAHLPPVDGVDLKRGT